MIIILSPAKTLRSDKIDHPHPTMPLFPDKTEKLMKALKRLSKADLKKLMKISDKLVDLNYTRNKAFETDFSAEKGEPAIFTFMGDVYQGLEADQWSKDDLKYAENRLFILSGLYGLLQPSTLVQPYRLEMGTALKSGKNENLYEFWDDDLTDTLNRIIKKENHEVFINLASKEYSKAVNLDKIEARTIEIQFREWRNGKWTFISFNAKKARGLMAQYIIRQRIVKAEELKGFDMDDYHFNEELSSEEEFFFTK